MNIVAEREVTDAAVSPVRQMRQSGTNRRFRERLTPGRSWARATAPSSIGCVPLQYPVSQSNGRSCSMAEPVEQSDRSVVSIFNRLASGSSLEADDVFYLVKSCFPSSVGYSYSPRRQAGERLPDGYQIVHELWAWFFRKRGWEPILNSLRTLEPAIHEIRAATYARTMLRNELGRLLGSNSTNYALSKTVRSALRHSEFSRIPGGRGLVTAFCLAQGNRSLRPDLNLAALCDWLPRIRGAGRARKGILFVLPSQKQIRLLMLEVFELCGSALTLEQIVAVVRTVFEIPIEPVVEFEPAPITDDREGWAESVVREIIDRIETLDGAFIESAGGAPRTGKLGKLLVDFMLWRGAPIRSVPGKTFGLAICSQQIGISTSTIEDWLKKELSEALRPLRALSDHERCTVWRLLRLRFQHRLPAIVDPGFFSF
jgi:hypothetical protein